jgi:shikimate dehydrogenase
MDIYGILAHPAHHSLSPAMHNAGFQALGMNAEYEYFDVKPEDLSDFIQKVRNENIKGLSVSKPHKETIIKLLDVVDDIAHTIGAVNTVINKDGELHGTNVDWIGVQEALLEKTQIEQKVVAVLGAGGAARAAVYALKKNHAGLIFVLNRTISHAEELAKEFKCDYGALADICAVNPQIIIQATSAGLNEKEGVEIIPKEYIDSSMTVMEMIYTPLMTRILKDAKAQGAKIITGDRMLLHQGYAAFEMWTGKEPPCETMEHVVFEHLN